MLDRSAPGRPIESRSRSHGPDLPCLLRVRSFSAHSTHGLQTAGFDLARAASSGPGRRRLRCSSRWRWRGNSVRRRTRAPQHTENVMSRAHAGVIMKRGSQTLPHVDVPRSARALWLRACGSTTKQCYSLWPHDYTARAGIAQEDAGTIVRHALQSALRGCGEHSHGQCYSRVTARPSGPACTPAFVCSDGLKRAPALRTALWREQQCY